MSADTTVIMTAIFGFILFLVVHVFTFRFISETAVLKALFGVYFISGIIMLILVGNWLQTHLWLLIVIWMLYSLPVFLYVFGAFGVIESSIRIRLLSLIGQSQKGITYKVILTKYNRDIILEKRLLRLITSGEIVQKKKNFIIGKKFSFFYIPAYLALVMKKLYG